MAETQKKLVMATSTKLSIFDVAPFVFGTVQQQIQFLQQKMLLAANMTWCNCNTQMIIGNRSDISDGCVFRCRSCKTTKSLRAGSFFDKSKLPLQKWLILVYWWTKEYPVGDAAEEAKVSKQGDSHQCLPVAKRSL